MQHRNIVTVFEFAEEANPPHIVMEFLRGMPLGSRMSAAPPLTLDDKLDIVAQLCAGLGYAHSQGVVHRDVKPANVFLLEDGTVKLLDIRVVRGDCKTMVGKREIEGPPFMVNAVAGDYDVSLSCPDGVNPSYRATVTQGRTARVDFLNK